MRTVTHIFENEEQARWFEEGVEWVNDSSLEFDGEGPGTVHTAIDRPGWIDGYMVVYTDEDHGDEDTTIDWRSSAGVLKGLEK